jgi:hypothetical protein
MAEVESTAKRLTLSKADVMRQSMRLGLPRLREQLAAQGGRITSDDPLPDAVLNRLYAEREEDEAAIRRFIAAQPIGRE